MSYISFPNEELLFMSYDAGWDRELPVRLITHENGSVDLHRQTGSDFEAAISRAQKILKERGLTAGPVDFIGPTGAYMHVRAIDTCKDSTP